MSTREPWSTAPEPPEMTCDLCGNQVSLVDSEPAPVERLTIFRRLPDLSGRTGRTGILLTCRHCGAYGHGTLEKPDWVWRIEWQPGPS